MPTVNGYACVNCAAEALAQRNIDPSKSSVELQAEARTQHERRAPTLGVNAPQSSGNVGSRLNVYA